MYDPLWRNIMVESRASGVKFKAPIQHFSYCRNTPNQEMMVTIRVDHLEFTTTLTELDFWKPEGYPDDHPLALQWSATSLNTRT